jgi:hypothetical protein
MNIGVCCQTRRSEALGGLPIHGRLGVSHSTAARRSASALRARNLVKVETCTLCLLIHSSIPLFS